MTSHIQLRRRRLAKAAKLAATEKKRRNQTMKPREITADDVRELMTSTALEPVLVRWDDGELEVCSLVTYAESDREGAILADKIDLLDHADVLLTRAVWRFIAGTLNDWDRDGLLQYWGRARARARLAEREEPA